MKKIFSEKAGCYGCGLCVASCPFHAVSMRADKEGFLYPSINKRKCSHCGKCEAVCPHKKAGAGKKEKIYLAAQAIDNKIRYASTSGGVFPILAEWILVKGGIVFGAAMGEDGSVQHKAVQDINELAMLQKTKYVQSNLAGCYEKVKQLLKDGKLVLFSGTPCQCQAVKQYVGKENKNLLLVDLICYGVPSPGIWGKYVAELERRFHGKLSEFYFRDKRGKDNGHTVSMTIGGKEYSGSINDNVFCRLYFRNYNIRPSCYQCPFTTTERDSDITIGDFWGIENVNPKMDDKMGTSLMILHNRKAVKLWEAVKEKFRYFQCTEEEALQPRLCIPTPIPQKRRLFMALNCFLPLSIIEKMLKKGWL
ncbi:MAG: Coenzyme F420 hydrogenase/dehydrogenase, beta subunit C-terminal domain [Clostridium sp.]|nr:Coenzyme F420 hydrogenase/dehydrogenase, beta subunit C-terminal domain [Clostridium sp.]